MNVPHQLAEAVTNDARPRAYTINEASRVSGFSQSAIRRAVAARDLRSELRHGYRIIDSADLTAWQAACATKPRASPRPLRSSAHSAPS